MAEDTTVSQTHIECPSFGSQVLTALRPLPIYIYIYFGEEKEMATGATHETITASELPEGVDYPRPHDDSRGKQYLLSELKGQQLLLQSHDLHSEAYIPEQPVQDEAVWAKLDPKFRNLCPANMHGMEICPGMNFCTKERVCNEVRWEVHVSIFKYRDPRCDC